MIATTVSSIIASGDEITLNVTKGVSRRRRWRILDILTLTSSGKFRLHLITMIIFVSVFFFNTLFLQILSFYLLYLSTISFLATMIVSERLFLLILVIFFGLPPPPSKLTFQIDQ